MIVIEFLEAVLKLGIPVFAFSWWAIHRRYEKGDITPGADHRTVKSDLKAYRKKWRSEDKSTYSLMENKWMRFGGGFYGITALATFVMIELGEFLGFLGNFSAVLSELINDGLIEFVIGFFVNQLQNFISAVIWFAYWTDDDGSMFIWVGVPYIAYLLGVSRVVGFRRDVEEDDITVDSDETDTKAGQVSERIADNDI